MSIKLTPEQLSAICAQKITEIYEQATNTIAYHRSEPTLLDSLSDDELEQKEKEHLVKLGQARIRIMREVSALLSSPVRAAADEVCDGLERLIIQGKTYEIACLTYFAAEIEALNNALNKARGEDQAENPLSPQQGLAYNVFRYLKDCSDKIIYRPFYPQKFLDGDFYFFAIHGLREVVKKQGLESFCDVPQEPYLAQWAQSMKAALQSYKDIGSDRDKFIYAYDTEKLVRHIMELGHRAAVTYIPHTLAADLEKLPKKIQTFVQDALGKGIQPAGSIKVSLEIDVPKDKNPEESLRFEWKYRGDRSDRMGR